MVHKLARMLVTLALCSPLAGHALGLGEINTRSALNQPLETEIALLSVRSDEVESIVVALAPSTAFAQAGIERVSLLSELRFKVAQKPNGNYYIFAYTQEPIKEPFLNFLVEVDWSAGHLVREYTVLLDPPVLMSARQPRIQAPVAKAAPAPQTATSAPQPLPEAEAAQPSAAPAETATAPVPGENTALIRPNDTLYPISQRLRPSTAVSPQQMMLALLKANPKAFVDNNVNNLKAGYRLRVPELGEITLISQDEALRAIKHQNALWAGAKAKPAAEANAEANAEVSGPTGTPARLKLVTTNDAKLFASASGGSTAQDAGTTIENLQKDLTLANETAEARRQENEDLRSRMAELENQVESMQRLITLKDENLANLQNTLSEPVPGAEAASPVPENATPQGAAQSAPATPAAKPAGQFSPAALQALWNDFQSNPMTQAMAGGAALLLLALLWVINRRKQMNATTITEADIYNIAGSLGGAATATVADEAVMEAPAPAQAAANNPLAEVDVYLAHEQYSQAETLLRQLIASDPYRHEFKLRLLEFFYLTKNKKAFGTQAEVLHAALADTTSPLWSKAMLMGKQLYLEHSLFASPAVIETEIVAPALAAPGPEIDFTLEIPAAEEKPAPMEHAPISFDFEIAPVAAAASETAAAKNDIDLSLADLEHDLESIAESSTAKKIFALDFTSDELALEPPSVGQGTERKREPDISFDFDFEKEAEALADTDMTSLEREPEEDTSPFNTGDEVSTKLDLARAYLAMGDDDGAISILDEVVEEGTDTQKNEAHELMRQLRT